MGQSLIEELFVRALQLAKKHDNIDKKDKKNAMPCFASLFNTHHAQHCVPINRLLFRVGIVFLNF